MQKILQPNIGKKAESKKSTSTNHLPNDPIKDYE